jgi:transposase-like protein
VENIGYSATGRKYGVSDNSIRKWIKMYKKYGESF